MSNGIKRDFGIFCGCPVAAVYFAQFDDCLHVSPTAHPPFNRRSRLDARPVPEFVTGGLGDDDGLDGGGGGRGVAGCDPRDDPALPRRGPRRDHRAPRPARRVRAPAPSPPSRPTAADDDRPGQRRSHRGDVRAAPRALAAAVRPASLRHRGHRQHLAGESRGPRGGGGRGARRCVRRGRRRARVRVGVLRDAHPPGQGGGPRMDPLVLHHGARLRQRVSRRVRGETGRGAV